MKQLKDYFQWLKTNWAHVNPILAIFITVFLLAFVLKYDIVVFLILLTTPVYLLHETEEYIFPGGFAEFFNLHIFKSGKASEPMGTDFIFYVNILLIWVLLPLCCLLSAIDYSYGLWIPYFCFYAGVAHIILGIKGKQKYNPGLIISLVLNIPYGTAVVYYFTTLGLYQNPWVNPHMLIGLGLNLMLPVIGVILKKHYDAKQHL